MVRVKCPFWRVNSLSEGRFVRHGGLGQGAGHEADGPGLPRLFRLNHEGLPYELFEIVAIVAHVLFLPPFQGKA
jgi:hypothetical protein